MDHSPPLSSSNVEPPSADAALVTVGVSRLNPVTAWTGAAILAVILLEFLFKPLFLRGFEWISMDRSYRSFDLRFNLLLAAVFAAAFCLVPALGVATNRLGKRWLDAYTYASLVGSCLFLWVFIVHFGRWQYGGYDFNIMVETGWRQIQGQRPYIDFSTATPPGFNLGIKYAYQLFGITWDANLYLSAIFACVTFLWMYWLMVRLSLGHLTSMAVAFASECAAMLTLCFWWYNDSVLILAAVFFLSCLEYALGSASRGGQTSYFVSLMLLSLMKPNIAGVIIAGGVVLLFFATDRKMRLVLLTLGAAMASVGVLLINHVPVLVMLASYLEVAKEHGGLRARFGYREMTVFDRRSALVWIAAAAVPLLGAFRRIGSQIRQRNWKEFALGLIFPLALLVALYGLATNGEYRNAECTALLAAGAVLSFGLRWNGPLLRRIYIAILCASIAGDLYYGAERIRVSGIGPHMFFEWQDNRHPIEVGYFKNMRVSSTMIEVVREVKLATEANSGPYFFGTRLDFNYAALGLPSPRGFPAWWEPGTAFSVSDQSHYIKIWRGDDFRTLVFLKANSPYGFDHTFYPQEFLDAISQGYVKDDSYSLIAVYRRR